ncbi:MAG: SDR family oxidoreductase [Sporichthyaceae bacterium]|nr:SDR family oxidoreductase [Sporichthyaceae bacterium]
MTGPGPADPIADSLAGQVALVTGGGRGIGAVVALGLARAGMGIGLIGRDRSALAEVAQSVRATGVPVQVGTADVTDPTGIADAVAGVAAELGPADLVVANAGISEPAPVAPWLADPDQWWRVVEVNVRGVLNTARAVLPGMVARSAGRLLVVGSGSAQYRLADYSAYGVSKAAASRLADELAGWLAGTGVVVLEASPGAVRLGMATRMWPAEKVAGFGSVEPFVELVVAFAHGRLDGLHGRFVHALRDDLDDVIAAADRIQAADARALRLRRYGPDDPLGG